MSEILPIYKSDSFQYIIDKKFKKLFDYEDHNLKEIEDKFNSGTITEIQYEQERQVEIKKINNNRTEVNNSIYDYIENIQTNEIDSLKRDLLSDVGLERSVNVSGLKDLVKNVQVQDKVAKFVGLKLDKSKKLDVYYIDLYFGIHLHSILRLSKSEASRTELWNSLSINKDIKKYLKFRNTYVESGELVAKLKASSFFTYSQKHFVVEHHLARPWWATELARNGSSYDYSKDAFKQTQMFTMRWNNMTLMHNRLFALSVINFITNQKFKMGIRDVRQHLGRVMNDYAASKSFDTDFENYIEEDISKFKEWQLESYDPKNLIGPADFNYSEKIIKNKVKLLKDITKNSVDARGKKFI